MQKQAIVGFWYRQGFKEANISWGAGLCIHHESTGTLGMALALMSGPFFIVVSRGHQRSVVPSSTDMGQGAQRDENLTTLL